MAGILGVLLVFLTHQSHATNFTNKDFLTMPKLQQKGFLDGVINTLWQVAAQNDSDTGQCIVDWYFGEETAQRNGLIFKSMNQYPTYTPSAIVIALTERECGSYIRRERSHQGQ